VLRQIGPILRLNSASTGPCFPRRRTPYNRNAVKQSIVIICSLGIMCSSALLGQTIAVPAKWVGTWTLNVSKSKFGTVLVPGVPADLAIVSQRLRLDKAAQAIRLSGDTVVSDSTGSHSSHDDTSLPLDGMETFFGPLYPSNQLLDAVSQ
jgi:hypothetical protein